MEPYTFCKSKTMYSCSYTLIMHVYIELPLSFVNYIIKYPMKHMVNPTVITTAIVDSMIVKGLSTVMINNALNS